MSSRRPFAFVMLAVGFCISAAPAGAVFSALADKANAPVSVKAKYGKRNMIRVDTTVRRDLDPGIAETEAMRRAAEMTRQAGFERFGVLKSRCGFWAVGGAVTSHVCELHVEMVGPEGLVQDRFRKDATYHEVSAIIGQQKSGALVAPGGGAS